MNDDSEFEYDEEGHVYQRPGLSYLYGMINDQSVADVITWIINENLAANPAPYLTLMINSPGGISTAAFALIEIMRESRIPVRTIALGEIQSAALMIFMAGAKGHRIVTSTCSIMSHHFSTAEQGTFHQLLNVQKKYQSANEMMIRHYIQCTGLSRDRIVDELLTDHDIYLTPEEAVQYGIADETR